MRRNAFTLIELLVVVAIIAILAAIAVPNFLEAQTRAKVSRAKSDHRTVAGAIELYSVDWNNYPPEMHPTGESITLSNGSPRCGTTPPGPGWVACEFANLTLTRLTTPIAYMSSTEATRDPFIGKNDGGWVLIPDAKIPEDAYFYVNLQNRLTAINNTTQWPRAWGILSVGPDKTDNHVLLTVTQLMNGQVPNYIGMLYDPTNGTVSDGDITRLGGQLPGAAFAFFDSTFQN